MIEEQTRAPESAHWESNGRDEGNGGGELAESVLSVKVQPVPAASGLPRSEQPFSNLFLTVRKQLSFCTFIQRPFRDWLGMATFLASGLESFGLSELRH